MGGRTAEVLLIGRRPRRSWEPLLSINASRPNPDVPDENKYTVAELQAAVVLPDADD